MVKIAFLDLDGCLADFVGGVCKLYGITQADLEKTWPDLEWNFFPYLPGCTAGTAGVEALWACEAWNRIDREGAAFWENLDLTADHHEILAAVESHFDNVVLMTSPPHNPAAAAGKVAWIRRHLPRYSRRFCLTPCKECFAHSSAVLIDDSDANLDKFFDAGGQTITVPRRWNTGRKDMLPHQAVEVAARRKSQSPGTQQSTTSRLGSSRCIDLDSY